MKGIILAGGSGTRRYPYGPYQFPESLIAYVAGRKGHDLRCAIDPSFIREALGRSPETAFAGGLQKTVRWYLDHRDWWENILNGRYRVTE